MFDRSVLQQANQRSDRVREPLVHSFTISNVGIRGEGQREVKVKEGGLTEAFLS